jgi:hypothetical protein
MEKVSIEVHSGAARFRVAVRTESVQRATSLVREQRPNHVVRVKLEQPKNLAA